MKKTIISSVLAMSLSAMAFTSPGMVSDGIPATPASLQDAITAAVKLNPKTVSTDELMESLHYSTLAAKAAMLPTGSFNCSAESSVYTDHYKANISDRGRPTVTGCQLTVTAVIYDGRAGYYQYKSAQASEEATKASYNTADALMTNTRGGLANSTMMVFVQISQAQAALDFFNYHLQVLNALKVLGPNDPNLQNSIDTTKQTIQQFQSSLNLSREYFKNLTTLPAADTVEDMDTTIASLKVPVSPDDAIRIALSDGPEVKRRNSNVEMAEYDLQAIRASRGPTVTVSASVGRGRTTDPLNATTSYVSNSATVGVYLAVPLDRSGGYKVQSAVKNLESKKSEREAAIQDAENTLRTTYLQLDGEKSLYLTMVQNFQRQKTAMDDILHRLQTGNTAGMDLTQIHEATGQLAQQFMEVIQNQKSILMNLFSIEQTTGLLFTQFTVIGP